MRFHDRSRAVFVIDRQHVNACEVDLRCAGQRHTSLTSRLGLLVTGRETVKVEPLPGPSLACAVTVPHMQFSQMTHQRQAKAEAAVPDVVLESACENRMNSRGRK